MASAVDQKTFWGLAEMVMWIRTRDHERVVALTDLSEPEAMVQAMFGFKPRFDPRCAVRLYTLLRRRLQRRVRRDRATERRTIVGY